MGKQTIKKALVTGGNGFLGRYIVEKLLSENIEVLVIGRNKYDELEKQGAKSFVCDLSNTTEVNNTFKQDDFKDIDVIFHTASKVALWGKWEDFYQSNILGTKNLLQVAIEKKIPRLIYTSTPSVAFSGKDIDGEDETIQMPSSYLSNYPKSKIIAETEVLAAGKKGLIASCSLRPHLIWGPRDNHLLPKIIKKAKDGELPIIGTGRNVVDFTYVENVADAHIQAAKNLSIDSKLNGEAYFISQDEPIILWDFIGKVLDLVKVKRPDKKIPYSLAYAIAFLLEIIYKIGNLPTEPRLTRFLVGQLAKSHHFSSKKAREDFNYSPQIPLEEGLKKYKEELLLNKL